MGKIVNLPGVKVVVTTRAEFSSIMYVVVEPSMATTRFVAPVSVSLVEGERE